MQVYGDAEIHELLFMRKIAFFIELEERRIIKQSSVFLNIGNSFSACDVKRIGSHQLIEEFFFLVRRSFYGSLTFEANVIVLILLSGC